MSHALLRKSVTGWPWLALVVGVCCVAVLSGCFVEQGPRAKPSQVEFDPHQQAQAHQAFQEAFGDVPTPDQPLVLVSPGRMRWSDLELGVSLACKKKVVDMAVVNSDIGDQTAVFHLVTPQGWPAVLRASVEGDEIHFKAVVGPYPAAAPAKARAEALEQAARKALVSLASVPRMPANEHVKR